MKRMNFTNLFLLFAWINFFALQRSLYASIIMICAGIWAIAEYASEFVRRCRK